MNYRGFMQAMERKALEEREAREEREAWVRFCEKRYLEAAPGQKAARLAELMDARLDVLYWDVKANYATTKAS